MASRVAASLAMATGLGEHMVCGSQLEYEERAVALGSDAEARCMLRTKLEAVRESCALFDTASWVAAFERVLLRMWEIHCQGMGPRTFSVA
jgi:protein O-GlcNAc transferase